MRLMEIRVFGQVAKKTAISFTGPQVRGFFLKVIKEIDENLANRLHSPDKPAPYAIKPLARYRYSKSKNKESYIYIINNENIEAGTPVSFGFSLLSGDIEAYWYQIMEKILYNGILRIGKIDILVNSVKINKIELNLESSERFLVVFKTPTFFRKKGNPYRYLFPDPVSFFTNIVRIWNSISGEEIDMESLTEKISSEIGVIMHKIKTSKAIDIGNGRKVIGFVGKCVYETGSKELSKIISKLLSVAKFTNVGGSRSLGFGAIEWIPMKTQST